MIKQYKKYKESGIEWVGEIPNKWNLVKLKFLAETKFSSVDRHELKEEIKVAICHYPQAYNNEKINTETSLSSGTCNQNELDSFSLKKGQVIITKDSETADDIGVPTYVEEDIPNAVCGYHLAILQSLHKDFNTNFLFRYLQSNHVSYYFEINSNGVTRFGLGKSTIENLTVPLPTIEEQNQIAFFLDNQTGIIDKLIRKKQKLIELLKEKRQSSIYEAVTKGINVKAKMTDSGVAWIGEMPANWELIRLKFIFKIKKEIAGELGYDVLSVTQKGIKKRDLTNLRGQLSMDYSKYQLVTEGDFIMNHMDLLTGYVDISKYNGVTSPDYRVFSSIRKNIFDQFYLYIFQLCYSNRIFFGLGQGVSDMGRWRMPSENFNNFLLPLPSLKEQKEITDYISNNVKKIDFMIEQQEIIMLKLKEYRLSMISETVTGKIDVRDWQPSTNNN